MLALFRRKAQSKFIQATIVIIILVFIFWGVGTNQGSGNTAVATVNGESITYSNYQKEYDAMINKLRDQFGGNIPKGLLEATNFKYQVVNQLIQATLMRQGAQDIGLYVSNTELSQNIQDMEAFKNNGFFDVQWYEEVLTGSRMTVSQFEEGLRYDLLYAKIIDHLARFGQVSQNELMELYNYNYNQSNLQYATFRAADFKEKVNIEEDDLTAYFETNRDNYKSAPQIKIKYINLPLSGAGSDASFPDQEILQKYKANIAQYTHPEERQASHILIKSSDTDGAAQIAEKRSTLAEILEKARNGEDFGELAKLHSEDGSASRGGDLGFFARGRMVKPFEDAAFTMDQGDVSEIIQTQFGFHILKLTAIKPSAVTPMEEVRKEIAAALGVEKGKTLVFQKANETYESIILSGSLDNYAASANKTEETGKGPTIIETNMFTQQDPPESLRALPSLVNTAFSLKNGELSSIIDTGDGYAIVYVQQREEPAPQKLADITDQVKEDLKNETSIKLAKEAATELLNRLKDGGNFDEETNNLQLTVETTGLVSRADSISSPLPQQILQQNFNLSESNHFAEDIAEAGDNFYVLAFKESKESDQSKFEEKKEELTGQLTQAKANTLLSAWVGYLQDEAEITTNETLL